MKRLIVIVVILMAGWIIQPVSSVYGSPSGKLSVNGYRNIRGALIDKINANIDSVDSLWDKEDWENEQWRDSLVHLIEDRILLDARLAGLEPPESLEELHEFVRKSSWVCMEYNLRVRRAVLSGDRVEFFEAVDTIGEECHDAIDKENKAFGVTPAPQT